ncbi:serine protease inhibitor Kazal-type 1-like [Schistocerca gregaria]|uniref:serine protease inhibitor Kazal-type 1-like n=1 Tax=Schistocerca gregaria TaxID=7010 RepID=UPI00211DB0CE|nr:serine protease inhibitor Kazal-type 1-like [Schistocerca gregaria]
MKLCVTFLLLFVFASAWGQYMEGVDVPQQGDYSAGVQVPRQDCPCSTTLQYDPVCGTDGVTYPNPQRLDCVRRCGKNVAIRFRGAC